MKRKDFLKGMAGIGALLGVPGLSVGRNKSDNFSHLVNPLEVTLDGSMVGFSAPPIEKVRVGIIGLGNRGSVLLEMFDWLLQNNNAEIMALCDLDAPKVAKAVEHLKPLQKSVPQMYSGGENEWRKIVEADDIDLVLICTPWEWHTKMAIAAMEAGKHAACEVPIAYTLEDCWNIVLTAERTRRHCIMIENCNYNSEELWVLNMVENGVFGDLTHAECAYLHDLRAHMLSDTYYKDHWRIKHHVEKDGNFYTTHGIGPVSMYFGIGRGDTFRYINSVSSREKALSEAAKITGSPFTNIKCGDVNTSLLKTEEGKSIMLQFDVHTGRPYSRINQLVGTKAVHEGYPSRLYIDGEKPEFYGHQWLKEEDYKSYRSEYEHPLIKKMKGISEQFKQGHGGMDFIMMYRLIKCLNLGVPLDLNVYDAAMWSAITPLSELSVAAEGTSIPFPDFTGGTWKVKRDLEIMRDL